MWTLHLCRDVTSQNRCTVLFFLFHFALKFITMCHAKKEKSGFRNSNVICLDCFLCYEQVYFLIKNKFFKVLSHPSFCISHNWVADHNQAVDLGSNESLDENMLKEQQGTWDKWFLSTFRWLAELQQAWKMFALSVGNKVTAGQESAGTQCVLWASCASLLPLEGCAHFLEDCILARLCSEGPVGFHWITAQKKSSKWNARKSYF